MKKLTYGRVVSAKCSQNAGIACVDHCLWQLGLRLGPTPVDEPVDHHEKRRHHRR